MIRTIPLKIQNEYITGDKGMIGAAGSHNDVILRMEFSGMWDGLTKMVQFRDALGEATIEVLLTADMLEADDTSVYLVPVPNGAKKYAGEMTLCIKGAAVSAQKETRATLAVYGRFTVAESKWSAEAETESDVPASNVEQLQGQIENVLATIVDARKAATEAAKSAEGAALSQSSAQTSEQYAGEYAQDAADSATAAANSAASASDSAASAADSIKHTPRINANGKWELWDATTNAYVATEYTAVGEDGTKWWTYNGVFASLGEKIWVSYHDIPNASIGDFVLHTRNDAGVVYEITGRDALNYGEWLVEKRCVLKGTDGTTPHIGANGNWYLGTTDTGKPARGAAGAKGDPGKPGADGKDGQDGADGYTPVYGLDYGTPEQIQEIAQSAAEILQPEVNQLKNDLTDLQTAKMERYTIKTVMDSVATPHTQYYLGNQTTVDIVLPDSADAGQIITVCWYNGETAATLSITGTMLSFDYTPGANSRSEINALWDGLNWSVLGNEMAVVVDA